MLSAGHELEQMAGTARQSPESRLPSTCQMR